MEETQILTLVNKARLEAGETSMAENQYLKGAAEKKATDMKNRDYFGHQDKSGNNIVSFLPRDYPYAVLGENIAFGFKNEETMIAAWMKSQTHRDNILDKNYRDTAVTVLPVQGKSLVVQVFGVTQTDFLQQKKTTPLEVAGADISLTLLKANFFLSLILFLLTSGLFVLALVRKKK